VRIIVEFGKAIAAANVSCPLGPALDRGGCEVAARMAYVVARPQAQPVGLTNGSRVVDSPCGPQNAM